jgi:hypothetical protein
MITALTLEDQPADRDEEQVLNMIRPDSPKLDDIMEAAAQYPCEVTYEDTTDISIKPFTDWTVQHLHHLDEAYTWPVSGMGKAYFRGSKSMVDRGALKQYDILVTKNATTAAED